MKRRFSMTAGLAVLSAVFALSGCGGNSGGADKDTSGQDEEGSKEILFWNTGTGETDKLIYETAVKKFNESTKSGYHITSVASEPDVYKEKIVIAMSSGECPDLYANWSGGPMNEYIEAGYGQPIDELFDKSQIKDKMQEAAIAQGQYKGKMYSIGVLNDSIAGIFYNKEMFQEYGLEVPKTVAELEQVSDTLAAKGKIPFALANEAQWTGSMFFMSLAAREGGLEPFDKAVAGEGSFEDESFLYAGRKIQEWVEKNYFPEGVNSLSEGDGQGRQLLYQEKAAMILMGSWYTSTMQSESGEFYEKVGWFPFPAIEGKEENGDIVIGTIGDQFFTFNCTGEKQQAAFQFIETFFDDDMVELMVEQGKIPPVKGVEDMIKDPVCLQILDAVNRAPATQLWYDQYLPPEVGQVHLDTCQDLFGLTTTPEDAAAKFQDAMEKYNAERK